jgi:enoyl-CoA hydratase/carnithine racemase
VSDVRIIVEKANGVAKVIINRPEKHNAMDLQFFREFGPRIDELSHDSEVRAIILTGAGPSFCSGIDLVGLAEVAREPASVTVLGQSLSEPFGPLQGVPDSLRAITVSPRRKRPSRPASSRWGSLVNSGLPMSCRASSASHSP